jgi:hypothetical protein
MQTPCLGVRQLACRKLARSKNFVMLFHNDCIEIADIHAYSALAAQICLDPVRMLLFAQYCFFRTCAAANSAAIASLYADIRIDPVGVEFAADMSRAFVRLDMSKVFIAEVAQRPENRIRRRLPQSAQGGVPDCDGQFLKEVQLLLRCAAF